MDGAGKASRVRRSGLMSLVAPGGEGWRRWWFRPTPASAAALPLGARSVGHYQVPGPWREDLPGRPIVQIYWGIAGVGELHRRGRAHRLEPGMVFAYGPGEPHVVRCAGGWEYRWWTMDGPLAAAMAEGYGLGSGRLRRAGACPEGRFAALAALIVDPDPASERLASALAVELLGCAAGDGRRPAADAIADACRSALDAGIGDPGCGIAGIARAIGVHRSALTRRFAARFGCSPQAYLAAARLRQALHLLSTTDAPVAAIAHRCGQRDPDYFARIIRRATGRSPRELRA